MRYALLTYNAPGGHEIWAAMTDCERQAEEEEYVRLVKAMRPTLRLASSTPRPVLGRCGFEVVKAR